MVTFGPTAKTPEALVTLEVDPKSRSYGKQAGRAEAPHNGDEFPPLRLERLQLGALPIRTAPTPRAPLSPCAGPPLVTHLRF